jgi:hypothetical protein
LEIGDRHHRANDLLAATIRQIERVPVPGEWGSVFGDDVLATAILDRLLHHCDVITINGPSYRLKDRLKPPGQQGGPPLE